MLLFATAMWIPHNIHPVLQCVIEEANVARPVATDPDDTGDLAIDVGRRLSLARRALGLQQQEFAARAGLSQPQYSQFETGKRRLTIEAAIKLCHAYSLTLDYLYLGEPSGLPHRLWLAINQIRAAAH